MLNSFCFLIKTRCEKSASTGLAPGTVDIDVNDKNTTTLHTSADVKSLTLFSQIQTRKKLRSPCLPQDQFHWSWVEVKSRPWRNSTLLKISSCRCLGASHLYASVLTERWIQHTPSYAEVLGWLVGHMPVSQNMEQHHFPWKPQEDSPTTCGKSQSRAQVQIYGKSGCHQPCGRLKWLVCWQPTGKILYLAGW